MAGGVYHAIVSLFGEIVAIELRESKRASDVWMDLDAFDRREGTDLYDHIDRRNLLDVTYNLDRSPYAPVYIIRTARDVRGLFEE